MSDLISREQAIDVLIPIVKSASLRNRNVYSVAKKCMSAIEELPSAADVVEVVRCRDCRYGEEGFDPIGFIECVYCEKMNDVWGLDDYCSYGERREDDKG